MNKSYKTVFIENRARCPKKSRIIHINLIARDINDNQYSKLYHNKLKINCFYAFLVYCSYISTYLESNSRVYL